MSQQPNPGTFLVPHYWEPPGRLGYTLRVDKVLPPDDDDERTRWKCTRFGIDPSGAPADDGHITPGHWLSGMTPMLICTDTPTEVCWIDMDGIRMNLGRMYLKPATTGMAGQIELF